MALTEDTGEACQQPCQVAYMATSSSLPVTLVSGCLRLSSGISGYQHICDAYTHIHVYTHTYT